MLVKSLLLSNRSQYRVSLAYFDEIDIFEIKSLRDCAAIASSTFAPILVPLFNSCFEITYSFSITSFFYKTMIVKAKSKLFS